MKKSLVVLMSTVAMLMTSGVSALAGTNDVRVVVNNEEVDFSGDQAPVIVNDRTLVPFRAVFEKIGAEVNWYEDTKTCEAKYDDISVSLEIGSNSMLKSDGTSIKVDVPAQIMNDRTMVPIRVISEGIGAEVDWDDETRTVFVSMPKGTLEAPKGVNFTTRSDSITNEKTGLRVTFEYPYITDNFASVTKLNTAISDKVKSVAKDVSNIYTGSAKELLMTYEVYHNDSDILAITYLIDGGKMGNLAYSISTGLQVSDEYVNKVFKDDSEDSEDSKYEILSVEENLLDENGIPYLTVNVQYPQLNCCDSLESFNSQIDSSVKKNVNSFINSYKDEAIKKDIVYHLKSDCTVTFNDDNTAVLTIKYSEYTGIEREYSEVITVDLTSGGIINN